MTPTLPAEAVLPAVRVVTEFPAQRERRFLLLGVELHPSDLALLGFDADTPDDDLRAGLYWLLSRAILRERAEARRQGSDERRET